MSLWTDLKILYHLALHPVRGESHQARLESFYGGQAAGYDEFRERLLSGRRELMQQMIVPEAATWLDLGGGTGANLEFLENRIGRLSCVWLVDLSPSLLNVARRRCEQRGWKQVVLQEADATTFDPGEPVDMVTFSYSLTMIPDWFAAIENAYQRLKPGGLIGVVDFYVSRKFPDQDRQRHRWWRRNFWPIWFGNDNVFLSADHLPYLERRFETVSVEESSARIPYLPLGRVPYYLFIGRKRPDHDDRAGDLRAS